MIDLPDTSDWTYVQKGDVVIVKIDFDRDVEPLMENFKNLSLSLGINFIVMPKDFSFEHIPAEKMNELGWYRREA